MVKKAAPPPKEPAVTQPTGPTYAVTLTSVPMDSQVWIDGKLVGNTPLMSVQLVGGDHTDKMKQGDSEISQNIRVGRRSPSRHMWRVSDGSWESGF